MPPLLWSRIRTDFVTIAIGLLSTLLPAPTVLHGATTVFLALLVGTSGYCRWTVTVPSFGIIVLQQLRGYLVLEEWNSVKWASLGLLFLATILCLTFTPIQLPPLDPIGIKDITIENIPVRILYPSTSDSKTTWIWYLHPRTAVQTLGALLQFGSGQPIPGWFLGHLCSIRVPFSRHTTMMASKIRGLIVFSHGLAGSAQLYTYQTARLAAAGYVVAVVDHLDGSNLFVDDQPINLQPGRDYKAGKLSIEEYVGLRRQQTVQRAQDVLSVVQTLSNLGMERLQGLTWPKKFRQTVFMGHSFGGSTVLEAASRYPHAVTVISHDPALDWLYSRRALLLDSSCSGGTGGWEEEHGRSLRNTRTLVLFSHEWVDYKWDLFVQVLNGQHVLDKTISKVTHAKHSRHTQFSDTCLILPLFLTRRIGICGIEDPARIAEDIHNITLDFLMQGEKEMSSTTTVNDASTRKSGTATTG